MAIAESLTVSDSDGAWQWEETFSWYCASCSKELGVNTERRNGEVDGCRFCGSDDISYQHWSDEPQNRRPVEPDPAVTAAEFGASVSRLLGDGITDMWTLRTEHTVQSVIIADGVIIDTHAVYLGAKWDAFLGQSALAYRKLSAAYTYRGDEPPLAYVIHWNQTTKTATLIDHDRITPESLLSLIEENS